MVGGGQGNGVAVRPSPSLLHKGGEGRVAARGLVSRDGPAFCSARITNGVSLDANPGYRNNGVRQLAIQVLSRTVPSFPPDPPPSGVGALPRPGERPYARALG